MPYLTREEAKRLSRFLHDHKARSILVDLSDHAWPTGLTHDDKSLILKLYYSVILNSPKALEYFKQLSPTTKQTLQDPTHDCFIFFNKELRKARNLAFLEDNISLFELACKAGYVELAQLLWEEYDDATRNVILRKNQFEMQRKVAEDGKIKVLAWLFEQCDPQLKQEMIEMHDYEMFALAANKGHRRTLSLIYNTCAPEKRASLVTALNYFPFRMGVSSGSLSTVKYLLKHCPSEQRAQMASAVSNSPFRTACENGNLDIVAHLLTYPNVEIFAKEQDPKSLCGVTYNIIKKLQYGATTVDLQQIQRFLEKQSRKQLKHLGKYLFQTYPNLRNIILGDNFPKDKKNALLSYPQQSKASYAFMFAVNRAQKEKVRTEETGLADLPPDISNIILAHMTETKPETFFAKRPVEHPHHGMVHTITKWMRRF